MTLTDQSFQYPIKVSKASAVTVVIASGIIMVKRTLACEAPSMNAASAYSQDIPLKVA